jgi:membrane protein YqaA with SNARE-associated domain
VRRIPPCLLVLPKKECQQPCGTWVLGFRRCGDPGRLGRSIQDEEGEPGANERQRPQIKKTCCLSLRPICRAPGGCFIVLFVAVAASWAGVPFIGATAAAAGAAASQISLNLPAVIIVVTIAGEVGELIGYAIGDRWGRELLGRPGKQQARRQKLIERGEQAYNKWGRLAVFLTPAIVSGTAKMRHGQFVVWNFSPRVRPLRQRPTRVGSDELPQVITRPTMWLFSYLDSRSEHC